MKKLPTNKSTIKKLIEENCCYVDKTRFIKEMVDDGDGYWFLSRPRRFGKSLFLDTIRAAFAGEKELFKGLYLENNWEWDVKYPVIKISFARAAIETKNDLHLYCQDAVNAHAKKHQLPIEQIKLENQFAELINKLYQKHSQRVVVLIDEYDKPLLDNLTNEAAEAIRKGLSDFYSVLKDSDEYLKFVFITGVSKFSKTSIFSKLNNLTDITLKPQFADICGYTQNDLETVFKDYLHDVDLKKTKAWYNGYNFLGSNVYNPYDVLLFLSDKRFRCYWFETGTPTFLLNLIKQQQFYLPNLEHIELSDEQLGEFDINNIELEVLLFQTGYLTIKDNYQIASREFYSLKIPNKEVKIGLNDYILRMFFANGTSATSTSRLSQIIYKSLAANTPEHLEQAFISFFAGIPHTWYVKNNIANYEGYYCSVFYSFFAGLGLTIHPEDITNKGRIDFTVPMDNGIFIFEIKMKSNPKNALDQLKEKKYHEKYTAQNKAIFLIGIEFDETERNLSQFEIAKIV